MLRKLFIGLVIVFVVFCGVSYHLLKLTHEKENELKRSKDIILRLFSYSEHEKADCFIGTQVKDGTPIVEATIEPVCKDGSESLQNMDRLGIKKIRNPQFTGNIDFIEEMIKDGGGDLYFNIEFK